MTNATFLLAAAAPSGAGAFFVQIFPLLLIFIIFWFLLIRPQQKRMKEHQTMVANVQKGDRVVTGGGLLGKVSKVTDDEVEIELAQGVKVKAVQTTLKNINDHKAKAAND